MLVFDLRVGGARSAADEAVVGVVASVHGSGVVEVVHQHRGQQMVDREGIVGMLLHDLLELLRSRGRNPCCRSGRRRRRSGDRAVRREVRSRRRSTGLARGGIEREGGIGESGTRQRAGGDFGRLVGIVTDRITPSLNEVQHRLGRVELRSTDSRGRLSPHSWPPHSFPHILSEGSRTKNVIYVPSVAPVFERRATL